MIPTIMNGTFGYFYMSGKVADYLSYREAAETAEDRLKTAEAVFGQQAVEKDRTDEAGL